ncbi:hypothetical protein ACMBCN_00895 [Candidatus Liberibacter asiaticus]|nr:hypothetical protein [Candidatus Liberibacter asiaticus]
MKKKIQDLVVNLSIYLSNFKFLIISTMEIQLHRCVRRHPMRSDMLEDQY